MWLKEACVQVESCEMSETEFSDHTSSVWKSDLLVQHWGSMVQMKTGWSGCWEAILKTGGLVLLMASKQGNGHGR